MSSGLARRCTKLVLVRHAAAAQAPRIHQRHSCSIATCQIPHHHREAASPASPLPRARLTATWPLQQHAVRGKKTRTIVTLDQLPQGPLSLPQEEVPAAKLRKTRSKRTVQQDGNDEANRGAVAEHVLTPVPIERDVETLPREEEVTDEGEDQGPQYPTVVMQARRNMDKFENCVLLTRVGGFYELYFSHAEEYGPMLNLKVAHKKTNAGPVPMAGFPFFQLERFLKTLVLDCNCYVAVAEEFPNDAGDRVKSGGLMHDRRVTRIITPGTLIDENFIDPYANNFVMAIHVNSKSLVTVSEDKKLTSSSDLPPDTAAVGSAIDEAAAIGLAWLDVSTGQFYTQSTTMTSLSSILSRVGPREIVVDDVLEERKDHIIFSVLAEDKHLITFAPHAREMPLSEWTPMLESELSEKTAQSFTDTEAKAGSLLLQYVKDRLLGLSIKLQPPLRHENLSVLAIDKNSMRALEIKQTIRDSVFRGSLLHAIRRTVTKGGARLLNTWVSAPSTSLETINGRQELVDYFIQHEDVRDQIIMLLRRSHDSQRLVQKFAFGRGDADDMVALCNTIRSTENIVRLLAEQPMDMDGINCFSNLVSRIRIEDPIALADRIRTSIDEDGLVQQHETEDNAANQLINLAEDIVASEGGLEDAAILPKTGAAARRRKPLSIRDHYSDENTVFMMKPEASKGLQKLHTKLANLMEEKTALGETLREQMGAASLTLRWTPNLGHIGHVKGKDTRKALSEYNAVSSSRSTRTLHIPEWTSLGQRIHQTRFQIGVEEQRIFADLRALVVTNLVKLRQNAVVLDELDIVTSFAKLAIEQSLIRPALNNGTAHTIIGGRHPTVEGGLREQGRTFTKNDCLVGKLGEGRVWLITGPNMAGKSTYLRQNALITILAQVGCFVPADHAELGIVDAIFSRVGSADDLYKDQSTFMVEMLETAQILRGATQRSLVIMDEVGRGTTPEDGTAVAFAGLWHLVTINKCRGLFATHFHELAELVREKGMLVGSTTGAGSVHGSDGDQGGEVAKGSVEMYCTDVVEDGKGGFVYVHKLRKGINRQSHALKVAHLAGLPEPAIAMAREILAKIGKVDPSSTGQTTVRWRASATELCKRKRSVGSSHAGSSSWHENY